MAPAAPILAVIGTGPRAGKTVVAAALMARARDLGGHPVGILPVSTGCAYDEHHDLVSEDGETLRAAAGRPLPPLVAAPYRFATDASPVLAARRAGLSLTLAQLAEAVATAQSHGDVVILELPSGGSTPIAEDGSGLDLAARLGARALFVDHAAGGVESRVGSLLEGARARQLEVGGVLLRAEPLAGAPSPELEALIRERWQVPVFPSVPLLAGDPVPETSAHVAEHRVLERAMGPLPEA